MTQSSDNVARFPSDSPRYVLTGLLRKGARELLAGAIEEEVNDYLRERAGLRDEMGRQLVVRNGYLPKRKAEAEKAFDLFFESFGAKYPAATACLEKHRDVLLTFYEFPAEHWGTSGLRTPSSRPSPRSDCAHERPRARAAVSRP